MSEYTFNIADYRPFSGVRAQRVQEIGSVAKSPSGFGVLTSSARAREDSCREARPAVVDIRSSRESHRNSHAPSHIGACPRRSKILHFTNFTNDVPQHVITMAPPDTAHRSDEDPDPNDFPTAA
jgi:hypothetical protein